MLDRQQLGYIAEAVHFQAQPRLDPTEAYRRFWFEEDRPGACAHSNKPYLVGLHNSWTPGWFKQLSEGEVLAHPCLLGRTLRMLLRCQR